MYYVFMSLVKGDERVQRNGIVGIGYFVAGEDGDSTFRLMQEKVKLQNAIPVKIKAVHPCTDNPIIRLVVKVCRPFISPELMSRTRIHCGNHLEVQYELLSYGIPLAALPVDSIGNHSNEYHQLWVQERMQIEKLEKQGGRGTVAPPMDSSEHETSVEPTAGDGFLNKPTGDVTAASVSSQAVTTSAISMDDPFNVNLEEIGPLDLDDIDGIQPGDGAAKNSQPLPREAPASPVIPNEVASGDRILKPEPNDCLLGRGRAIDHHEGNIKFRNYLKQENLLQKYHSLKRHTKGKMTETTQRILQDEYNIRFLKEHPSGTGWQVADAASVREKIARTFRRILKQQQQPGQSS